MNAADDLPAHIDALLAAGCMCSVVLTYTHGVKTYVVGHCELCASARVIATAMLLGWRLG